MNKILTPYFVATTTMLLSACSSSPENVATDNTVYYPQMNDSIAMGAVFPKTLMDTTYLGAGPNAGEIAEITPRWGWKAANLDTLQARYPEAKMEDAGSSPITVYYELGGNEYKSEKTYKVGYYAKLPGALEEQGDLGHAEGEATFEFDKKGWHLTNNVYNVKVAEQREAIKKAKKEAGASAANKGTESANERLVTINWLKETSIGGSQLCASQAYKRLTFSGSNIMEIPSGQTWLPVNGNSWPFANSALSANIKIEADDDQSNRLPCYFGALRELPENRKKNIALAKDEFHKYYGGTKIRFWGQGKINQVTLLVIGPGPLPAGAVNASTGGGVGTMVSTVATSAQNPEPRQEQSDALASTEKFDPAIFGLFGDAGVTLDFNGNVGNLAARYNLHLGNNQIIEGTYYYIKKPAKKYNLEGKLNDDGTMTLKEYTGDQETATCSLKLSGSCYTGRMQNTDGRSFNMTVCR